MKDTSSRTVGILYVVATPIGNREDLSARALNTLKSVDSILAEDTRHSRPFLTSLGVNKPIASLHAHNEAQKSQLIIEELLKGLSIALISDAGTPLISDPGYPLIKLARAHHIEVVPIPGPCALITALSAAGVACDVFTFGGFLPAKSAARQQKLEYFHKLNHTVVFYESTHRIIESVQAISQVFGAKRELILAKELTKLFERFVSGCGDDIVGWLQQNTAHCKGEFVLIIPPNPEEEPTTPFEPVLSILLKELPLKQAVKLASQITGVNKNALYTHALTRSIKPQ
jgi:16S rRNA (cytidine1402-2'-O)-methyltransferase